MFICKLHCSQSLRNARASVRPSVPSCGGFAAERRACRQEMSGAQQHGVAGSACEL